MAAELIDVPGYHGPCRRHSSDDERAAFRRKRSRERWVLGWLIGALGTLALSAVTGIGGRAFDAIFKTAATAAQPEASAAEVAELRHQLDRHVATADMNVAEWRRDQQALERYRERMDERTQRIERKLDLILSKLNIRPDIVGSSNMRPPLVAQPPAVAAAALAERSQQ